MQEQYGSQFFSYSLVFRLQKFKLSLRRKEAADDLRVVLMALQPGTTSIGIMPSNELAY
jgi:hypothetical protein